MAIDLDELAPRKPKPQTVLGEDLSAMSAHELESPHRRTRSGDRPLARSPALARATKNAADAFFKR